MIARLRLHPLGLLAGASSVVAAVRIEAVRFLSKNVLIGVLSCEEKLEHPLLDRGGCERPARRASSGRDRCVALGYPLSRATR